MAPMAYHKRVVKGYVSDTYRVAYQDKNSTPFLETVETDLCTFEVI